MQGLKDQSKICLSEACDRLLFTSLVNIHIQFNPTVSLIIFACGPSERQKPKAQQCLAHSEYNVFGSSSDASPTEMNTNLVVGEDNV